MYLTAFFFPDEERDEIQIIRRDDREAQRIALVGPRHVVDVVNVAVEASFHAVFPHRVQQFPRFEICEGGREVEENQYFRFRRAFGVPQGDSGVETLPQPGGLALRDLLEIGVAGGLHVL